MLENVSYSGTIEFPAMQFDILTSLLRIWWARWFLTFFVLGAIICLKGFQWFRLKRLIENMPTSKIRSIAMGIVEVAGKVKLHNEHVLLSPVTAQKCMFYLCMIQGYTDVYDSNGVMHKDWANLKTEVKLAPYFRLSDGTGEVLVESGNAKGLKRVMSIKNSDFTMGLGPDPESVKTMLSQNKFMRYSVGSLGNIETFRYHEFLVRQGDSLYVMGTAGKNPFIEAATAKTSAENIMISKGRGGVFYISERGERDVVEKLKRDSVLGLAIGAAFMLLSFTIILINWRLF